VCLSQGLDEAHACHDAEPARGAQLLRQIDPGQLPVERRSSYAFLINHVLREKLSAWNKAPAKQQQLNSSPSRLPRQLGAAALAAGASGCRGFGVSARSA